MGSASSKFRRHLQNGDEYSALQVFETNPELRKTVDPNCFYWDPGNQCTPLHLAARHAMKPLLRVFLEDMQGDPNVRTGKGETALHLASRVPYNVHARTSSAASRRAACLALLVLWRGSEGETVLLDAQDQDGNTALHYAAASGIKKCVELLVSQKASLFVENNQKETACDVASRAHHTSVAEYLEIKMVFSDRVTIEPEEQHLTVDASDKGSTGLRPQDLQEAKDLLLVETSDMFHVPLFTAEALLRTHDWSQVALLEAWVQDPVGCCLGAGVQPTTSALHARDVGPGPDPRLVTQEFQDASLNSPRAQACHLPPKTPCNICSEPMRDDPVAVPCQHHFCFSCWQCYLTLKIQEGSVKGIVCPAVDCPQLVPVDVIEQLVSPEMVRRYLQFDIEAFVETNPDIKWCPWAGCGRAVKLPVIAKPPVLPHRAPPVSHAVDCGNGHYFCWECRGGAHAPCSCDLWKQWRTKVAEVKPEELESAWCHTEDAANSLWMVTNSKPCPSCKSPIQKNEGCNHLKCYKCKHDFCWVCLDPWRKHNSATGGYFRCNRFEAVHRAEERANTIISEAEAKNKEMRELQRFAYYYTHFKEHESSHQTEEALLERAAEKEELWLSELGPGEENQSQARFLCSAVQELLRARRILCGSYAYGFYLYEDGYGRTVFDLMQRDLEEASGKLSGMLCGRHLRCPRRVVVEATDRVARKRLELLRAVAQGLVPPESPPRAPRGVRKRPYPTVLGLDPPEDEQVLLALLESVGDAPLDDPWVKDVRGCHANVAALFDWPPENDSNSSADEDAEDLFGDVLGVCARDGCSRPRARNPRTREMHEHCSFKCHRLDRNKDVRPARYEAEFSMDLLIALEMSRLQMIEDQRRFEQNQKNGEPASSGDAGMLSESLRSQLAEQRAEAEALVEAIQEHYRQHAGSGRSQDTNSERQEAGGSGGALSPASPYGGATPSSESGRVGDAGGVRPLGTRNLATGASDNSHKLDKQLFGTQSKGP
ncbi:ankyrin repeat and IBR domain-containing protein 1 isoform X1 [Ixodes scapularis]|uniref:ankyrin repeat and IBR domain-containing protein 1 isoform X1 n=1 Tax=Ixodes scapularis TaxID=6945 RepID=UPI001A9F0870|nr:ankyrin repeat and IBR domain-containing protein 1 isoform X1 [Ixodes scapularis]